MSQYTKVINIVTDYYLFEKGNICYLYQNKQSVTRATSAVIEKKNKKIILLITNFLAVVILLVKKNKYL